MPSLATNLAKDLAHAGAPLDAIDISSLLGAYSFSRLLRSSHTGPIFRVRRSSDDAEADVGVSGDVVDINSLSSFCVGSSGFVVTAYDQSGNSRDLSQSTSTDQPKIYDSSSGPVISGGVLAANFDGVNDRLFRSDACGLTGDPGIDVFHAGSVLNIDSATQAIMGIGGTSALNDNVTISYDGGSADKLSIRYYGGNQIFDDGGLDESQTHSVHARRAAGDGYGDGRMWASGSELTEDSSSGAGPLSMTDDVTNWGVGIAGSTVPHCEGMYSELLIFGSPASNAISASDAETLRGNMVRFYGR